jgi:hypothetical protein
MPNTIDLSIAKNYNIRKVKDQLISQSYDHNGLNEYAFTVSKK